MAIGPRALHNGAMSSLHTVPLGSTFGVRVIGTPPAAVGSAQLGKLLDEHLVVMFESSDLDDAGQQELVAALGSPYVHPLAKVMGATDAKVTRIVDDADHPPFQNNWHTDVTWDPDAPTVGSLRCIEMPDRGGDTMWADMYAAYEGLSPAFRECLAPLTAWHHAGEGKAFASKAGADVFAKAQEAFPGVERPVVEQHPSGGRRYLNVNSAFTSHIVGLRPEESSAILDLLYAHIARPDWQYRHRWTEGEFGVWDERATQHYALADHFPARREMARFVVAE